MRRKKTYKFETNCNKKLADVTDYAVVSFPRVENGDKIFAGWYDNEGLSGDMVTLPYYGDETTLYAAWADRTGSSFEDALLVSANRQYSVKIDESGQQLYYEIVPKATGEYRFYSTGSLDTCAYLYDGDGKSLTSNDNGGEGNNFEIAYDLTAGETYYIALKLYGRRGSFTFVIEADCEQGTQTTLSNNGKTFTVEPVNIATGSTVILALYNNGAFVETITAVYDGKNLVFKTKKAYTDAKVMVVDGLTSLKPVCEAEIVK